MFKLDRIDIVEAEAQTIGLPKSIGLTSAFVTVQFKGNKELSLLKVGETEVAFIQPRDYAFLFRAEHLDDDSCPIQVGLSGPNYLRLQYSQECYVRPVEDIMSYELDSVLFQGKDDYLRNGIDHKEIVRLGDYYADGSVKAISLLKDGMSNYCGILTGRTKLVFVNGDPKEEDPAEGFEDFIPENRKVRVVTIQNYQGENDRVAYMSLNHMFLCGVSNGSVMLLKAGGHSVKVIVQVVHTNGLKGDPSIFVSNTVSESLRNTSDYDGTVDYISVSAQHVDVTKEAQSFELELLSSSVGIDCPEVVDKKLQDYFSNNAEALAFSVHDNISLTFTESELIYGIKGPFGNAESKKLYFKVISINGSAGMEGSFKFKLGHTKLSYSGSTECLMFQIRNDDIKEDVLSVYDTIPLLENVLTQLQFVLTMEKGNKMIHLDCRDNSATTYVIRLFCGLYGYRFNSSYENAFIGVVYLNYDRSFNWEDALRLARSKQLITIIRVSENEDENIYNSVKDKADVSVPLQISKNMKFQLLVSSCPRQPVYAKETQKVHFDDMIKFNFNDIKTLLKLIKLELARNDNILLNNSLLKKLISSYKECVVSGKNELEHAKFSLSSTNVRLEDIGGLSTAKQEIQDAIMSKSRKGVLFYGPPGCGKTLLAKAMASSLNCSFLQVKGPELMNMYVGETEKSVRELFQYARELNRCILFFDEIDALLGTSSKGSEVGDRVSRRIVSQFTLEMDNIDNSKKDGFVLVVGATNRPDMLDSKLLRPGRFDRHVLIGPPKSPEDKMAVLKSVLSKLPLQVDELNDDFLHEICLKYLQNTEWTGADFYALSVDTFQNTVNRAISALPEEQLKSAKIFTTRRDLEEALMKRI
ncbi:hypothetical protein MP638_001954 [Amoeboaphelidium occidentale]|nr:hypothetical protein MP638_001954 [Amoeboaphelidium occidentale]